MPQHDMDLANQTRTNLRADLNNALLALISNSSGATEPATMFAYQFWADTTTGLLKQRNAANNAWITIGTMASANLGLATLASPTLVTPNIGVATATSVNKVAITAPAIGSTLTIADGKTLTVTADATISCTPSEGVCTPLAWQNAKNLKVVWASNSTVTITADEINMPLAPTPTGSNLATGNDGAFTSGVGSWGGVNATLASVAGGDSGNCLELTRTGGSQQYARDALSVFGLTAGKYYEVSVKVKSGTSGNEQFYLSVGSSSPDYFENKFVVGTSSGSWVQYKLQFKCPAAPGSNYLYLCKNSATAGTMLFDTVDIYELASTGEPKKITNVNETLTITTAGIGGLGNGAEVNSMWYYIYLQGKSDGTIDAICETSPDGSPLVSGYLYESYAASVYNNSSGHFDKFAQNGRDIDIPRTVAVNYASATSVTQFDMSAIIPVTAMTYKGFIYGVVAGYWHYIGTDATGLLYTASMYSNATGAGNMTATGNIAITTPQKGYYWVDNGSAQMLFYVTGYGL